MDSRSDWSSKCEAGAPGRFPTGEVRGLKRSRVDRAAQRGDTVSREVTFARIERDWERDEAAKEQRGAPLEGRLKSHISEPRQKGGEGDSALEAGERCPEAKVDAVP